MESLVTSEPLDKAFTLANSIVEPQLNLIQRDGAFIQVERQVMLVLLYLVQRAGQVVTREEIQNALWSGSFPNDEALTQAVSKLRKSLGDSPVKSQSIQTIRKVGYRLIGPIGYPLAPVVAMQDRAPSPAPKKRRRKWSWVTIALVVGITSINAVGLLAKTPTKAMLRLRAVNPGVDTTEIDLGSIGDLRRDGMRLNLDSAQVQQVMDMLASSLAGQGS